MYTGSGLDLIRHTATLQIIPGIKIRIPRFTFETSTTFIMNTGSADHLCKGANLFVEKISTCPKINILSLLMVIWMLKDTVLSNLKFWMTMENNMKL